MIPVSIPFIAPNQKSYVNDCLDRNWISAFGKYDRKLVESFSEFVGTDYASTCSNGTVALHLALLASVFGQFGLDWIPTPFSAVICQPPSFS